MGADEKGSVAEQKWFSIHKKVTPKLPKSCLNNESFLGSSIEQGYQCTPIGNTRLCLYNVRYYLSLKHEGSSYRTQVSCKARGLVQSALDDNSYLKQANDLTIHTPQFIDLDAEGRDAPNFKMREKC